MSRADGDECRGVNASRCRRSITRIFNAEFELYRLMLDERSTFYYALSTFLDCITIGAQKQAMYGFTMMIGR